MSVPGRQAAVNQPTRTSAPPSTGSATPVMKLASSEARNSAAFATSHAVPIRPRSGTLASRSAATSARLRLLAARVSTAIGVHESWQDAVGANAVWSVLQSELLGKGDHCRFSRLVGDEGVAVLARSHRRNVDDGTGALKAHDRQYVLASHDRAAQVDRADAVEGLLAQLVQRLVATPDADPDIVVQDINEKRQPMRSFRAAKFTASTICG